MAVPAGTARCGIIRQLPLPCLSGGFIDFLLSTHGQWQSQAGAVLVPHWAHPVMCWDVVSPPRPTRSELRAWCSGWATTCHRVKCTTLGSKALFALLKIRFFFKFNSEIFLVTVGLSTSSFWWLKAGVHSVGSTSHCLKGSCGSCWQTRCSGFSFPACLPQPPSLNISLPQVPCLPSLCDTSLLQSRVTQCNGGNVF